MASTIEIIGNKNGFVGNGNDAGCCGTISFSYNKINNNYCTVVITGSNQTIWEYSISCPIP